MNGGGGGGRQAARLQQFTVPQMDVSLRANLRTCTAVHVGYSSITWTQLRRPAAANEPSEMIDWACHPIPVDRKTHLIELIDVVLRIVDHIPASDAYVFESQRVAQPAQQGSPTQININVQSAQTLAMLTTLLAHRSHATMDKTATDPAEMKITNVLFMRQYLASR